MACQVHSYLRQVLIRKETLYPSDKLFSRGSSRWLLLKHIIDHLPQFLGVLVAWYLFMLLVANSVIILSVSLSLKVNEPFRLSAYPVYDTTKTPNVEFGAVMIAADDLGGFVAVSANLVR